MTLDLVIRDVFAVLPTGITPADIEVRDGTIVGITKAGNGSKAKRTLEGEGREAFPGIIDPHTHFRAYDSIGFEGDEFRDLGEAAVRGGVTSLLAFVIAPSELAGMAAINPVLHSAEGVPVDYGFHYVLWPTQTQLDGLPELYRAGIRSYKMFFAYPDRGFMFDGAIAIEAFDRIQQLGGLALVHAEEGHTIRWIEERARNALGSRAAIEDFLHSRPERLEAAGIELIALWASLSKCPVYVVHLSTARAIPVLRTLRTSGWDITVETCPQYLILDANSIAHLGALAKFAPVARTEEDQAALWGALMDGLIEVVGSDHAGHVGQAKKDMASEHGIFGAPFGIPGVETLFPLLYTHALAKPVVTREHLAAILSTNTARRFGWFPAKGVLQLGADADLIIVDPDEERPVRAVELRSRAGYSPYEGMVLRGWPQLTVRRGEIVFDGKDTYSEGGRFLPTDPLRLR